MRRGCQWLAVLLLLAGCGGTPRGERPSATEPAPVAAAVTARDARALLAAHPEALVLDVRNPDEWNDDLGHIEGARQIPFPELEGRMGEIAAWKEKPIVVVCRVGGRSEIATGMLRAAGYRQAVNLEGGMAAWRESEARR